MSENLVFIGGCPRSGTTLVQRMFGAHPNVYAGPEFDLIPAIAGLRDRLVGGVQSGRVSPIGDAQTVDVAPRELIRTLEPVSVQARLARGAFQIRSSGLGPLRRGFKRMAA